MTTTDTDTHHIPTQGSRTPTCAAPTPPRSYQLTQYGTEVTCPDCIAMMRLDGSLDGEMRVYV